MAAQNTPFVRMRNVRKERSKGGHVFELRIPEFHVYKGEFIAVVGDSGCGKSTMLDMLGLALHPTACDEYCIDSDSPIDVPRLSDRQAANVRKRLLGYVLQTGGLLPFLTVAQNIMLPCRINGDRRMSESLERLCKRLGISEQLAKKPQFLSGGQRQRAAIARALAHSPPLILADEPTAAVDNLTAEEIRNTFFELAKTENCAVVIVTHNVSLVTNCVDRTYTFKVTRESQNMTRSCCFEKSSR